MNDFNFPRILGTWKRQTLHMQLWSCKKLCDEFVELTNSNTNSEVIFEENEYTEFLGSNYTKMWGAPIANLVHIDVSL